MKADPTGPMVACPSCAKRCRYGPANRWRPFCSERCRTNDLGAWASEAYVIAGKVVESNDDSPDAFEPPTRPLAS